MAGNRVVHALNTPGADSMNRSLGSCRLPASWR